MILISLLLLLCTVFLIVLYIVSLLAYTNPPKKRPNPHHIPSGPLYEDHKEKMLQVMEDMVNTSHESITLTSYDGLTLHARLFPFENKKGPVVLFFHGYHGTAEWDGYGMYQICKKLGYPILMPDVRAHGKSDGIITFGIRERHDVSQWISFVLERFGKDTPIILSGVSMGATSILLATQEPDFPSNVKGIISDCAFSHPSGILKPILEKKKIPSGPLFLLMRLSAKLFGRFNLTETVAINAIQTIRQPVLFLHGAKDFVVPVSMCEELYNACTSPKDKLILEEANHANSALTDFESYATAVFAFIEKITRAV